MQKDNRPSKEYSLYNDETDVQNSFQKSYGSNQDYVNTQKQPFEYQKFEQIKSNYDKKENENTQKFYKFGKQVQENKENPIQNLYNHKEKLDQQLDQFAQQKQQKTKQEMEDQINFQQNLLNQYKNINDDIILQFQNETLKINQLKLTIQEQQNELKQNEISFQKFQDFQQQQKIHIEELIVKNKDLNQNAVLVQNNETQMVHEMAQELGDLEIQKLQLQAKIQSLETHIQVVEMKCDKIEKELQASYEERQVTQGKYTTLKQNATQLLMENDRLQNLITDIHQKLHYQEQEFNQKELQLNDNHKKELKLQEEIIKKSQKQGYQQQIINKVKNNQLIRIIILFFISDQEKELQIKIEEYNKTEQKYEQYILGLHEDIKQLQNESLKKDTIHLEGIENLMRNHQQQLNDVKEAFEKDLKSQKQQYLEMREKDKLSILDSEKLHDTCQKLILISMENERLHEIIDNLEKSIFQQNKSNKTQSPKPQIRSQSPLIGQKISQPPLQSPFQQIINDQPLRNSQIYKKDNIYQIQQFSSINDPKFQQLIENRDQVLIESSNQSNQLTGQRINERFDHKYEMKNTNFAYYDQSQQRVNNHQNAKQNQDQFNTYTSQTQHTFLNNDSNAKQNQDQFNTYKSQTQNIFQNNDVNAKLNQEQFNKQARQTHLSFKNNDLNGKLDQDQFNKYASQTQQTYQNYDLKQIENQQPYFLNDEKKNPYLINQQQQSKFYQTQHQQNQSQTQYSSEYIKKSVENQFIDTYLKELGLNVKKN